LTHIDIERHALANLLPGKFVTKVNLLVARNLRFRSLFLFNARQMMLSLMGGCADKCSVVWPYLLRKDDKDGAIVSDNVKTVLLSCKVSLRSVAAACKSHQRRSGVGLGVSIVNARCIID
jgi:hypothetical protein